MARKPDSRSKILQTALICIYAYTYPFDGQGIVFRKVKIYILIKSKMHDNDSIGVRECRQNNNGSIK